MPAIDPNLLQCVFYVYDNEAAAKSGEHSGACGFFVARNLESHPTQQQLYAVTNRHCVKDSGPTLVLKVTKTDGTPDYWETKACDWIEHKDRFDVAVLPIEFRLKDYEYNYISSAPFFLTPAIAADVAIGPGDDIFMVGRFIGQDGRQRNLPTVRFGIISRMNGEPIPDEYGIDQDTFLVEMRSLAGYSGSPVFVQITPGLPRPPLFRTPPEKNRIYRFIEHGPWLLGVDWCHFPDYKQVQKSDEYGKLEPVQPAQWVEAGTGMAGVIPAWRIQEILDSPELIMQRKKLADEYFGIEKMRSIPVNDLAHSTATQKTNTGSEIPIPTEEQFFDDLKKASRKKD